MVSTAVLVRARCIRTRPNAERFSCQFYSTVGMPSGRVILSVPRPPLPRSSAEHPLPIQKCKVSFVDRRGVYHAVDVQAATVFEAVCRASAIFKHSVVEDPTWAAEFVVEVVDKPKAYRVKPDAMKKWLARSGRSPRELMEKKKLRELLT